MATWRVGNGSGKAWIAKLDPETGEYGEFKSLETVNGAWVIPAKTFKRDDVFKFKAQWTFTFVSFRMLSWFDDWRYMPIIWQRKRDK